MSKNTKSYKNAATLVEAYLESIGKAVKRTQALEVVARAHGAKNWNVLSGTTASGQLVSEGTAQQARIRNLVARIQDAKFWRLSGSPLLSHIEYAGYAGEPYCPENEVFYLGWEVEGVGFSEKITEEDLLNARCEGNTVIFAGEDGEEVLELFDAMPDQPNQKQEVLMLIERPALTASEMEPYADQPLTAVVAVGWDVLGDMDYLNDYVSERITGSISDLVGIGYEIYHPTDAERREHGTPDGQTVWMKVTATWYPED